MDSGIYQLTFANGDTYVGKSLHLATRWQHSDKLSKGTAAKNMMQAYWASDHQYPTAKVILYCHPDVLDEYENLFINDLLPTLNTQRPTPRRFEEREALARHAEAGRAGYAVPVLMMTLENLQEQNNDFQDQVVELETIVDDWNSKVVFELKKSERWVEIEATVEDLYMENFKLLAFKQRVEHANWFVRLFNLW
mgnify:CR=1 FL=1